MNYVATAAICKAAIASLHCVFSIQITGSCGSLINISHFDCHAL